MTKRGTTVTFANEGLYIVEDPDGIKWDVRILDRVNKPCIPNAIERAHLNAYFASDDARDPVDGKFYTLLGEELPGLPDGVVFYRWRPEGPLIIE